MQLQQEYNRSTGDLVLIKTNSNKDNIKIIIIDWYISFALEKKILKKQQIKQASKQIIDWK